MQAQHGGRAATRGEVRTNGEAQGGTWAQKEGRSAAPPGEQQGANKGKERERERERCRAEALKKIKKRERKRRRRKGRGEKRRETQRDVNPTFP
jgi:hypothetical protein